MKNKEHRNCPGSAVRKVYSVRRRPWQECDAVTESEGRDSSRFETMTTLVETQQPHSAHNRYL